jgi:hypothetical protein
MPTSTQLLGFHLRDRHEDITTATRRRIVERDAEIIPSQKPFEGSIGFIVPV